MTYYSRTIESKLQTTINRGKSILLLGPRQTGKTTLLQHAVKPDLNFSLLIPHLRQRFEREPENLLQEIEALWSLKHLTVPPLVLIDEIQKVPVLMDIIQYLIDNQRAQFILTGSSARKLKKTSENQINLLPGRVVTLYLDALTITEMQRALPPLESLMLYGNLPAIYLQTNTNDKTDDLRSYVETYLEEEIRREALVRNLGAFNRFLELAAGISGEIVNFTKLSQEVGVNIHLIQEYYQILEDCLIVDRVDPVTKATTRRRLTKAPKYLFFDLGVRRFCAREGTDYSAKLFGTLFEQFVGCELLRCLRLYQPAADLKYWRDHNGPEVDFVIDQNHQYVPIEVKWTTMPSLQDCRHLEKFIQEYPCLNKGYLICRVETPRQLSTQIMALPWQYIDILWP